ncbi:hypothetical protein MCUN1_000723 [Malassezia cuniculi]|uniref:F-box/LRR-repeat protein 15/At3g58940/PEG3-like LRR domain-containing protein n=1 Tax=Malassezia cuniculi TaxID=948313 RepID=A0AAF0J4X3_9BASI|nr:hypothetical protein MCUN1_000723 [Malassezia cuniculi]
MTLDLPLDIVRRICQIVYLDAIPLSMLRMLDPFGLPSAAPDGQLVWTSVEDTRRDLYSLCLVSRAFCQEAQPLLFRRIQITLPYRFMLLLNYASSSDAPTQLDHVRMVDFSSFRAVGLLRTVGESTEKRFVTADRLTALLDSARSLVAFGASETMDSALSLQVLESLLFRDGEQSSPGRMRGVSIDRGARKTRAALQSLDLCGCVSAVFLEAMREFVNKHLAANCAGAAANSVYEVLEEEEEEEERGRGRGRVRTPSIAPGRPELRRGGSVRKTTQFASLQRLGLAGVRIARDLLAPFVLSFPNLTHLDLSGTHADAALLNALARSSVRLESLSLSRCYSLTSESITKLIVSSAACEGLVELAIAGTLLFPSPVSADDLRSILTSAPCMLSGEMRYLDLGGCPLTDAELGMIPPQQSLLDLGLSACPDLSLGAIRELLRVRAPNVQVLDIAQSATGGSRGLYAATLYHELIAPCTEPPHEMVIAMQLKKLGLGTMRSVDEHWQPPTNLRVIELSHAALESVQGGIGSWKAVWGAGRRGWVVDTSAGPNPDAVEAVDDHHTVPAARHSRHMAPSTASRSRTGYMLQRSASRDVEERRGRGRQMDDIHPTIRSLSLSARPVEPTQPRNAHVRNEVVRTLPEDHPRSAALLKLASMTNGAPVSTGWHSRKMEVLLGYGLLGREIGNYAWLAYQNA